MRVFLDTDMEGASWITDYREIVPAFTEYWRHGRSKLTAEVVSAALGLLDGGASEVVVINQHGFGWPNLLPEEFPDRVRLVDHHTRMTTSDASFQLGFHAMCGTPNGFLSHTMVPGHRIAVNGAPITECHEFAWNNGRPVLGIVGDAALGRQLTGTLAGTPFLAVKQSKSRWETVPIHRDPAESAEAIRAFARRCALDWRERSPIDIPTDVRVEFSMDPVLAEWADGQHGLRRVSPAVLRVDGRSWHELGPARSIALQAAAEPVFEAWGGLELSSEEAMNDQPLADLEHLRRYVEDFATWDEPTWRTE